MKFQMTVMIDAADLKEAWESAPHVIPRDLSPSSLQEVERNGMLAFSLAGGGREIRVDLNPKDGIVPAHSPGGLTHRGQV